MGKIIRNGIEFSSTVDTANNISYDNSLSGLEATTAQKAIDEVVESLYKLDYDNAVDLSGILNGSGMSYTPPKSGIIICKYQATGANAIVSLNQNDVYIMFLNVYNQYARGLSQAIVNPEPVTVIEWLNVKIEDFRFIPFK